MYVDQRKHLSRTQCFLEPTKAPSVRWAATSDTTQQLKLPRDLALSKNIRLRAGRLVTTSWRRQLTPSSRQIAIIRILAQSLQA
jgi:hypothetical protein